MPFNPINYGNILAQTEGIQGARMNNALNAQRLDPNSIQNQLAQAKISELQAKAQNPAGVESFGKQIQYGMDADGKTLRGFAVGDQGTLKELPLPPGMTWADTYSLKDMGAYMAAFGNRTGFANSGSIPSEQPVNPDLTDIPTPSLSGTTQAGQYSAAKTIPPQNEPAFIAEQEQAKQGVKAETEPAIQRDIARSKGKATREQQYIDTGLAAADSLPTINRTIDLLKSGVQTGGWDSVKLWATDFFGVTGADEGELSANLGKAVLSQLRATFGAAFTEREGARLARIEAGFGKSPQVNLRLLGELKVISEREARRGIAAAKSSGDNFAADEIARTMKLTAGKKQTNENELSADEAKELEELRAWQAQQGAN